MSVFASGTITLTPDVKYYLLAEGAAPAMSGVEGVYSLHVVCVDDAANPGFSFTAFVRESIGGTAGEGQQRFVTDTTIAATGEMAAYEELQLGGDDDNWEMAILSDTAIEVNWKILRADASAVAAA